MGGPQPGSAATPRYPIGLKAPRSQSRPSLTSEQAQPRNRPTLDRGLATWQPKHGGGHGIDSAGVQTIQLESTETTTMLSEPVDLANALMAELVPRFQELGEKLNGQLVAIGTSLAGQLAKHEACLKAELHRCHVQPREGVEYRPQRLHQAQSQDNYDDAQQDTFLEQCQKQRPQGFQEHRSELLGAAGKEFRPAPMDASLNQQQSGVTQASLSTPTSTMTASKVRARQTSIFSESVDREAHWLNSKIAGLGQDLRRKKKRDQVAQRIGVKKSTFSKKKKSTTRLATLVSNHWFNSFWHVLIVASAALNGWHAHHAMVRILANESEGAWFHIAELVFSCLFLLELLIRLGGMGFDFFCGDDKCWNIFDAVIVISTAVADFTTTRNDFMRMFRGIRVIRLLRAIRGARILMPLRLMVTCMLNCVTSLFWALLVVLLVLSFFSILFLQAAEGWIVNHPMIDSTSETLKLLKQYYADLPSTMFSLFMAVTGGADWGEIAQPMGDIHWGWGLCFVGYIFFTVLGVFNVLIGLFVEQALDSSKMDKDLVLQAENDKTDAFTKDVKEMFMEMDTLDSGQVSKDQFIASQQDPRMISYMRLFDLSMIEPSFLFRLLDKDCSGYIDLEELVVGMMRCAGQARSSDMLMLITLVRGLRDEVKYFSMDTQEKFGNLQLMRGWSVV